MAIFQVDIYFKHLHNSNNFLLMKYKGLSYGINNFLQLLAELVQTNCLENNDTSFNLSMCVTSISVCAIMKMFI